MREKEGWSNPKKIVERMIQNIDETKSDRYCMKRY